MGSRFIARLAAKRDTTALAMRNAIVRLVPAYAAATAQRSTLLEEVHDTWQPVLKQAAVNQPLGEADLEPYRALGVRRAGCAFPLREVRAGFEVAHSTGLRECLATMEAGDGNEPIAFTAWGVRELPRVMEAVESSYMAACSTAKSRTEARELLVERLLDGRDAHDTANAAGLELPSGYLVLLCRRRDHRSGPVPGHSVLHSRLAAVPGLLWRADTTVGGLLILLPVHTDASTARAVARDLIASTVHALGQRLDTAEALAGRPADVPQAVREAQEALVLVAAMPDAQNRPYGTDELLVELAVSRQPVIQRRLAGLLAPLQEGTDLRRTLETLFDCGLDRQRTTAALHIHRRSLTYRIQRIRELTGLDPTTAHGIQLLRAALTAGRLTSMRVPAVPLRAAPDGTGADATRLSGTAARGPESLIN